MRRPGLGGAFWPSDGDEEMLRVALGLEPAASLGWDKLDGKLDLDGLRFDQYRMLPLLWRALSSQGVESPLMPLLRGIHRKSWYRNSLLLGEASAVAKVLGRAGIDVLVLKGAALTLLHYDDYGSRSMIDLDMLVPRAQARQSVETLLDAGWTFGQEAPGDAVFDWLTRVVLRNDRGLHLDLHWDFLSGYVIPAAQRPTIEAVWAGARTCPPLPGEAGSAPRLRALGREAQLLHTVIHGAQWASGHELQWIADATRIIQPSDGALDWDRLGELAASTGRRRVLGDALAYLGERRFAPVPAGFADELRRGVRLPVADRLRRRSLPPSLSGVRFLTAEYLDLRAQMSGTIRVPPPAPFLRAVWNLAPTDSVTAALARRLATILRRAGRRNLDEDRPAQPGWRMRWGPQPPRKSG